MTFVLSLQTNEKLRKCKIKGLKATRSTNSWGSEKREEENEHHHATYAILAQAYVIIAVSSWLFYLQFYAQFPALIKWRNL